MLYKIFVLILLCSFHSKCDTQIQSKEVDCEICSCKTVKIRFAVEFQVTCEGNELTNMLNDFGNGFSSYSVRMSINKTDVYHSLSVYPFRQQQMLKIVLSERIFREEPKPNLTRKVIIKIVNFTEAKIDKSFLSIWSSYTSCLLDIKEKTESVGLKLISSQIDSLNLFEVSQETLNFLEVENSIIDSIKAILIWKTTVGLIDTSAIILGKGTIFDLRESSIACLYEEPNAYFVPKPPQPLKFENLKTVDNNTEGNDRYQVKFGFGSKKGGINMRRRVNVLEYELSFLQCIYDLFC
ncbi:hypothetical protein Anas_06771 [Armadillidium nasatum]|uniref:Uncharacterized protein n=1 Tax=Armadillidium nasatum TaxID=96803 RepID=A0A5N5SKC4_9CRUS|nr:hypothetical protein Anas_06771 [Armadillidium nasatum]